jgi:hypothetical protein
VGEVVETADLETVADLLGDWLSSSYAPFLSTEIAFDELFLTARDVDGGPELTIDVGGLTGEVEDPVVSLKDTLVVSLRTGLAGRNKHGKFYTFPSMAADRIVGGMAFSVSYRGVVHVALGQLRDAAGTAGTPWCVASGELGTMRAITTFGSSLVLGTQKRRQKPR